MVKSLLPNNNVCEQPCLRDTYVITQFMAAVESCEMNVMGRGFADVSWD